MIDISHKFIKRYNSNDISKNRYKHIYKESEEQLKQLSIQQ